MSSSPRFHPHVASDLREAIDWWDGISVELGNRFRVAADAAFDEIGEHAGSFPIAFDDVRFARLERFP